MSRKKTKHEHLLQKNTSLRISRTPEEFALKVDRLVSIARKASEIERKQRKAASGM